MDYQLPATCTKMVNIKTIVKEAPRPPLVTQIPDRREGISQHLSTQPSHVFNVPNATDDTSNSLLDGTLDLISGANDEPLFELDDSLLEYCLNQDWDSFGREVKTESVPERGTEADPLDNPMFDSVFDLSDFLDPTPSSLLPATCTQSFVDTQAANETVPIISTVAVPPSPLSSLSPSMAPSPFTSSAGSTSPFMSISPSPFSSSVASPTSPSLDEASSNKRKRKASNKSDAISASNKIAKQNQRREKNNVASKVSRAKRKQKAKSLFEREKELVSENAQLRLKVEEMAKEAEELKKLLICRLATQ